MQMVSYQKLYNILREKILKKEFVTGKKIPTEKELCNEYGVSRITVRHALMLLQEQNFIERIQGRGTYVRVTKPKKVAIMDFAYSQTMKQKMSGMVRKLISKETVIPPIDIITALNLLQNEECLFFERLDILEGEPLAFDQVYIPLEFSRSITSDLLTRIDFFSAWEKSERIKGSFVHEEIEATEADKLTSNRLDVALGTPILMGTETMFDSNDRPLAVFISKYKSDKFKLTSSYSLLDSRGCGL